MGPYVGLVVPDVVGVVYVVPSGSNVMPEGGGLAGMVVLAGGCDMLVLHITSLVAGVGASWGASRVVWGLTMLLVVRASPCALPLSLYSGTLLMWLASAIPYLTRLPLSLTLSPDPFSISYVL